MNRLIIALMLICAVSSVACGTSNDALSSGSASPNRPMTVKFRNSESIADEGVTRMTFSVIGVPHTAARIDSVTISMPGRKPCKAVDIDGVDFGRWFQWEDTPSIEVEIDFPGTNYKAGASLIFYTPRGNVKTTLK